MSRGLRWDIVGRSVAVGRGLRGCWSRARSPTNSSGRRCNLCMEISCLALELAGRAQHVRNVVHRRGRAPAFAWREHDLQSRTRNKNDSALFSLCAVPHVGSFAVLLRAPQSATEAVRRSPVRHRTASAETKRQKHSQIQFNHKFPAAAAAARFLRLSAAGSSAKR